MNYFNNRGNKMKKRLLLDFNLIIYSNVNTRLKTGIYNVEYNIIKQFLENYGDKYDFYACCGCDKETFNETIKLYPEFKDVKYLNCFNIFGRYKNFLKIKIYKLRQKKTKSTNFKIILLKLCKLLLSLAPKNTKLVDIDVYLSITNYIPKYILNNKKIKKLFILHDALGISNPEYFEKTKAKQNKLKNKFVNLYLSLKEKVKIIFVSNSAKEETFKYLPDLKNNENKVVFLAADKNKYYKLEQIDTKILEKYKISVDKKYILSLCSLNKRKNLDFLVKAYVEFLKRNEKIDDLYLVLAGPSGWMVEKMFEEIDKSGKYKDKIILAGFIDEEDINTIYNGAFCFVYPSLLEGFGLPILEAMQCGIPVISSNTTSMPEVYGDAGIGIDPTNQEELVDAIGSLYFNKDRWFEVAKKCLERSKLFSWEKTVKNIEAEI